MGDAEVMREQRAGQTGEHRRNRKGKYLEFRRVDAHGFGCNGVFPYGQAGSPLLGVDDIL